MFICSVRMSTLKFAGAIVLCLAVLISVFLMADRGGSAAESVESVSFEGVKGDAARREFLSGYGWQLASDAAEEGELVVPKNLGHVLTGYNEIQRAQGLNIAKYTGKTLERYTYIVKNYPNYEGKVYANLYLYRDRVVGADICSAAPDGFIHGLSMPE